MLCKSHLACFMLIAARSLRWPKVLNIFIFPQQIEEHTKALGEHSLTSSTDTLDSVEGRDVHGRSPGPPPAKKSHLLEKFKGGARKVLLQWAQKSITRFFFNPKILEWINQNTFFFEIVNYNWLAQVVL